MRIDAQQKELFELFSGNQRYEVPMYQRNYAWKAEQVTAFLDDLKTAVDNAEDHFFGSVVLLAPEKNNAPYSIIDGQQRMTTFVLLIAIIRDQIAEFGNTSVMVNGMPVNLDSYTTSLLRSEANLDLRFDSNNRLKDLFDRYVLLEPAAAGRKHFTPGGTGLSSDEKKITVDLRRSFFIIKNWLREYLLPVAGDDDEIKSRIYKLLMTVRTGAKLLRLVVDNEDDAFLLFETLNDRGLRLTPSDLLKSFTLRRINDGDPVATAEEALEQWDEAVDTLGDYPFTKFLRHYLLSVQPKKVQVSKIFNMFKTRINEYDEVGAGGALRNLHELSEGAKQYASLLNEGGTEDAKLNKVIARLNLLSETHRVLLLRALHFRFQPDQVRELALALEVLAFRWIITGGNAQEIESFYQDRANELKSDDAAVLAEIITKIIAKAPSDEAVHGAILQNPASRVSDHQFYLLQKLNYGLTGVELAWVRKQLHIEHLAPQKPLADAGWFEHVAPKSSTDPEEKVYDDFLNQWGNLTLLEYEINIPIGNSDWATKVNGKNAEKGLKDTQVSMTKNLIGIPQWNKSQIADRTRWVADSLVALTSLASYKNPGPIGQFR